MCTECHSKRDGREPSTIFSPLGRAATRSVSSGFKVCSSNCADLRRLCFYADRPTDRPTDRSIDRSTDRAHPPPTRLSTHRRPPRPIAIIDTGIATGTGIVTAVAIAIAIITSYSYSYSILIAIIASCSYSYSIAIAMIASYSYSYSPPPSGP